MKSICVVSIISQHYDGTDTWNLHPHYNDVIMGATASQITSLTIVCSAVYSGTDQRKHQSSASLAFVRGIHRGPVNSPHKGPVTRKILPFDDVIMHEWQESLYSAWLIPCPTISWWRKELGDQQPYYCPSRPGIFHCKQWRLTDITIIAYNISDKMFLRGFIAHCIVIVTLNNEVMD